MKLDKLIACAAAAVVAASLSGQLPKLQLWIWKAQAQVVRESRTSNWGSPRFFPKQRFVENQNHEGRPSKNSQQITKEVQK